ncbi:MAG: hypothetical protein LBR64_01595 [Dysgonamonadaceae bacterium]|jgi:hypothetical protein|nr:hypothetical protein [Dysgonamonadaceae bacterium]
MKRTITFLVLIFACIFVSKVQAQYDSGSGTADDPYIIKTAAQLSAIRDNNGSTFGSKYFKLANDIDLTEYIDSQWPTEGWLPIGWPVSDFGAGFYVVVDGDYHTISGLWINRPNADFVGLFGRLTAYDANTYSKIKNLGIIMNEDKGGIVGHSKVGALTGVNNLNLSFEQVFIKGTVHGVDSVGGLTGDVKSRYSYNIPIRDCYFVGTVEGTERVGGLGGIVGSTRNCYIENCYFLGYVKSSGTNVGGLLGLREEGSGVTVLNNNYFVSDLNPGMNGVGNNAALMPDAGKSLADMKKQATYENWDFTNVWKIDEETSTPYFKWQSGPIFLGINAPVAAKNALVVTTIGNTLRIKGFTPNETINVYTVSGAKIYSAKAKGSEVNVNLPAHGVYIVSAGAQKAKTVY